jgi:hypothetical protein
LQSHETGHGKLHPKLAFLLEIREHCGCIKERRSLDERPLAESRHSISNESMFYGGVSELAPSVRGVNRESSVV